MKIPRSKIKQKWITRKRWRRELKLRQKNTKHGRQASRIFKYGYESPILDQFDIPFRPRRSRAPLKPKSFQVPSNFSLSDEPVSVLNLVNDLIRYSRSAREPRITIDHRKVSSLGLGAEALLALVLKEIRIEYKFNRKFSINGHKPSDLKIRQLVDEIGCARVVGADQDDIRISLTPNAKVYRHHNRGITISTSALTRDRISDVTMEFCKHLEGCLKLIRKELTPKGRDRILEYVGEVLTNAQDHSQTSQWVIVGYLDISSNPLRYQCVILSIGNTIAKNFLSLSSISDAWTLVEPYIEAHEKSGFFSENWKVEDLLTVIALQGNVSSKLDEGPDRGQGTVDLIEFFQSVCKACVGVTGVHEMHLISGCTRIVFDGTYRMEYRESDQRSIIAFNGNNSLLSPPDSSAVKTFKGAPLPGVLLSISFPLTEPLLTTEVKFNERQEN